MSEGIVKGVFMAIYQLKENQKECLRELFAKLDDSLIISCIQNYFGDAWVDDAASPKSGQIICGDFCFLAGVSSVSNALSFINITARMPIKITIIPIMKNAVL